MQPLRPPCPIVYYQPQWQCSIRCPVQVPPRTAFCCSRVCHRLPCGNAGLPLNTVNCSPAHLVANGQERNEKDSCEQHPRRPLTFKDQKKPSEAGRKRPPTANASDASKIPPAKSSPKLSVKRAGSQQPLKPRSQTTVKIGKDKLLDAKRQDGGSVRSAQEKSYLSRTPNVAQGSGSLRGGVHPKGTLDSLRDVKGPTRSGQRLHAGRSSRDEKRYTALQLPEQSSAAPVDDGAKQTALNSLLKDDEEEVSLGNQAAVLTANKPKDLDEEQVGEMEEYEDADDDKKGEEADVEYENEEGVAEDNLVKLGGPTSDHDPSGPIHIESLHSPKEKNPVEGHKSSQDGETLEGITIAFRDSNSVALLSETTELDELAAFEELMDKSVILSEDSRIASHALSVKSEKPTDIDAVRRRTPRSRSSDESGSRNMSSTTSGLSERTTAACHILRQRVNDVYHMTTKATSVNLRESASHLVSFVQNQARVNRATVHSTQDIGTQKTASTISRGITESKDRKKIKDTTRRRDTSTYGYGTSMTSVKKSDEKARVQGSADNSLENSQQSVSRSANSTDDTLKKYIGMKRPTQTYCLPRKEGRKAKGQGASPVPARGVTEASVERMASYKSLPRVASTGSDKKSQAERTSREVEKSSMTKSQGFGFFRKAPRSSADKAQEIDPREQDSVRSLSGSGLSARSYSHPGEARTASKVQGASPVPARGVTEASVERMASYKSLPRVASTGSDKKSQAERTSREVEKSSMTKSQGFGFFRKAPRSSADKAQEIDPREQESVRSLSGSGLSARSYSHPGEARTASKVQGASPVPARGVTEASVERMASYKSLPRVASTGSDKKSQAERTSREVEKSSMTKSQGFGFFRKAPRSSADKVQEIDPREQESVRSLSGSGLSARSYSHPGEARTASKVQGASPVPARGVTEASVERMASYKSLPRVASTGSDKKSQAERTSREVEKSSMTKSQGFGFFRKAPRSSADKAQEIDPREQESVRSLSGSGLSARSYSHPGEARTASKVQGASPVPARGVTEASVERMASYKSLPRVASTGSDKKSQAERTSREVEKSSMTKSQGFGFFRKAPRSSADKAQEIDPREQESVRSLSGSGLSARSYSHPGEARTASKVQGASPVPARGVTEASVERMASYKSLPRVASTGSDKKSQAERTSREVEKSSMTKSQGFGFFRKAPRSSADKAQEIDPREQESVRSLSGSGLSARSYSHPGEARTASKVQGASPVPARGVTEASVERMASYKSLPRVASTGSDKKSQAERTSREVEKSSMTKSQGFGFFRKAPRSSADKVQEIDPREQESVRSLSGSGLSARSYSHPGEARTASKVQGASPVPARGVTEASVERMASYKSLPRVASTGSDKKSQAERTSREVEKSSMTKSQGFGFFRKAPRSSADKVQEIDPREQESVRSLSGSGLSARSYSHPGEARTASKVQGASPVPARGVTEASVERMASYKSLPRVASTGSDKKSQAERTSREVEMSSMTKSQGFGFFRKAPRSSADKAQEIDPREQESVRSLSGSGLSARSYSHPGEARTASKVQGASPVPARGVTEASVERMASYKSLPRVASTGSDKKSQAERTSREVEKSSMTKSQGFGFFRKAPRSSADKAQEIDPREQESVRSLSGSGLSARSYSHPGEARTASKVQGASPVPARGVTEASVERMASYKSLPRVASTGSDKKSQAERTSREVEKSSMTKSQGFGFFRKAPRSSADKAQEIDPREQESVRSLSGSGLSARSYSHPGEARTASKVQGASPVPARGVTEASVERMASYKSLPRVASTGSDKKSQAERTSREVEKSSMTKSQGFGFFRKAPRSSADKAQEIDPREQESVRSLSGSGLSARSYSHPGEARTASKVQGASPVPARGVTEASVERMASYKSLPRVASTGSDKKSQAERTSREVEKSSMTKSQGFGFFRKAPRSSADKAQEIDPREQESVRSLSGSGLSARSYSHPGEARTASKVQGASPVPARGVTEASVERMASYKSLPRVASTGSDKKSQAERTSREVEMSSMTKSQGFGFFRKAPRSSADKAQEIDPREQDSVRSLSGSGLSARSYSHPGEARTASKVQGASPVPARGVTEASVERMASYKSLPRVASTGSDKKSQAERTSREVEKSSMTKSQGFGFFRKAPRSSADKAQEIDPREQESVRSLSGSGLSARSYSHPGEARTASKVQGASPVPARGVTEASVERMASYKSLPRVASTGSDKKSQAERTSREVEKSSMTKSQGFGFFRRAPSSSTDLPREVDSNQSVKSFPGKPPVPVLREQNSPQSVKRIQSAPTLPGKSSGRQNELLRPVDSGRTFESTKRSSDKSSFLAPPRGSSGFSSRTMQSSKTSTDSQNKSVNKARHQGIPPESSPSLLKKPLIRTPSSGAPKSSTQKSHGFSLMNFSRKPKIDASQPGAPGTPKNASVSRKEPSVRGKDHTKSKQLPTPSSRSPKSSLSSDPVSQSRSTTRSSSLARSSGSQSESSARGRTPVQAKKLPAPSVRRPKSSSSLSASMDYSGPTQSKSPAKKVPATLSRGLRSLSSGSLSTEQIAHVCSPLVNRVRSNVEKMSMRLRKSIRHLVVTLQHPFGDQQISKYRNRTRLGGAPKPSPKKSNVDERSGRKLKTSPIKTSSLGSQRESSEVSGRDKPPVSGRKPVQSKVAHPPSVTSDLEDRTQSEDHDSRRVAPHSGSDRVARVQEKRPTALSPSLMNMLKKRWTSHSFGGGAQKTRHVRDRTRSHSIQRELVIRLVRLTRSLSVRMRDLRQKATPLTERIGRSGKRYATQAALRIYEIRALYPPIRARVVSTVEQMRTMARASSEKAPNVVQSCILQSKTRVLKLRSSSEELFARTRAKLARIEDPLSREVSREEFDELQLTVRHIHREVHLECEQIKSLLRRSRAMRKKTVDKKSAREAPKTEEVLAPVPESDNDFVTREEFNNLENGLKTLSKRIHQESGNIRMLLGEVLKRRNKTSARWKSVALDETKYGDRDDGKEAAGASPSEGAGSYPRRI
ncbi:hypothetical protein SprV_0902775900 [Sparganum proliferum]